MKTRRLRDLEVSTIGLGCMGFSHGYGPVPEPEDSIKLMRYAFDKGCTFFDTAEGYAAGANEELVGRAILPIRNSIVLATKYHLNTEEGTSEAKTLASIRSHLEKSLMRLKTDRVELYYLHRINPEIPLESIASCMGDLIEDGKICGWGLSQSSEDETRRAHAIAPLTAVQSEYSMMERMFEKDVVPACKELGIGFVPFSPLAGGFLSGKVKTENTYTGDDVRRVLTRYQPENIAANQPLLDLLTSFSHQKNATPAQVSLAWMLRKGDFIVPIPGMRSTERIQENLGSAEVVLSDSEFEQIEQALAAITIHGNRTDQDIAKLRDMD